ncbi:hypothetical protein [Halobacillus litoralis]|uniref:hypothetical protein n=1 Tax=Halobacillus litoralis TaxID=45668 RepID=UPI001CFE1056|nr:hypothetical protein [Halobacillus litoralis]
MKKKNDTKKVFEVLLVFTIFFLIDALSNWFLFDLKPSPILFALILFSLMYGRSIGLFTYGLTLLYLIVVSLLRGKDILLLFFDIDKVKWLGFYLIVTLICTSFYHIYQRRYEQVTSQRKEIQIKLRKQNLKIHELKTSNKSLTNKVLTYHNTPKTIYHMFTEINQSDTEKVLASLIKVTINYFKSSAAAVYKVDTSRGLLQLDGDIENVGQHEDVLYYSEAPSFYQRLMNEPVVFRNINDEEEAPLLAGIIPLENNWNFVLVLQQFDLERVNDYELQLLEHLLHWASYCIEKYNGMDLDQTLNDFLKEG